MQIVYQPIVAIASGQVQGYEALARFGREDPAVVFRQAHREGRGVELEFEAVRLALEGFKDSGGAIYLSVNASAATVIAASEILSGSVEMPIPWDRVVVELTEHDRVDDYLPLYRPLSNLRARGARVAIDDVGTGFSGLWHIAQTMPDILKIDRALIRDVDTSPIRRAMVKAVAGFGREIRSIVVAEGIEREDERAWCEELGVHCGQGYLFGKPEPM